MDRRAFIGTLAGGLLAAPLAAEAQQVGKVYRVGLVSLGGDPTWWQPVLGALRAMSKGQSRREARLRQRASGEPTSPRH